MYKIRVHSILRKKKNKKIAILGIILLILIINISPFNVSKPNGYVNNNKREDLSITNQDLKSSNGDSVLFQGSETSLNITDTSNLFEFNQEVLLENQEETNLTYYLEDIRNWNISKIETNISNIYDTRNWVNNSGFKPVTIYRNYQVFESAHDPYVSDRGRLDTDRTIQEDDALYIRAHFANVSFHDSGSASTSDHLYIYNSSFYEYFEFTGNRDDFYSPWVSGDTLDICYQSDNQNNDYYGYRIDYYEFVNSSSNLSLNLKNWKPRFSANTPWGANTIGSGIKHDSDAMFLGYHGDWADYESFIYYTDTYSEMYQENIQIPRGNMIDAYVSFDYLLEFGFNTNNIMMYLEVNDEKLYSKGMLDIATSGKNVWHSTGKVPLYLWENSTKVFDTGPLNDQVLNITVGIKNIGNSVQYSGYEDVFGNIVWFDNISLVLTTVANSSQDGINLTINGINLNDGNEWGKANLNITGPWNTDTIILTMNSTSPSLSFEMNTTIYGYRETTSSYNQQYEPGIFYTILENGTVLWELYHNLYMPPSFENFKFSIEKPVNWEFRSILDPFLQTLNYTGGNPGDNHININVTFAGWYILQATSPNYLNISNTKIYHQGQWLYNSTFKTGDTTQITTQLNYTNEIPNNIGKINLTIYHPNGIVFYEESRTPEEGNVTFSEITFGAYNTSGGIYEYTLFWSNGIALGGLKSSFVVIHQSSLTLLKPDDAKIDLITNAFLGDLIPLRIQLKDFENNHSISGALITYNWSNGLNNLTEAALGVYEAILYTSDLESNGVYEIFINSSKTGFERINMTIMINLLEETNLLRLDSSYNVELHDNSTVRYSYTNSTGGGISGATIDIDINEIYYSITDHFDGNYTIEFDTSYINNLGVYQINLNFSIPTFETQDAIFQFEIIEQSVNMSIFINSQEIQENSLIEAMFKENLNISVRVFAEIDEIFLSGGNITWNSDNYYKKINEAANAWFNYLVPLSSNNFSVGLNFIYLRFEQENFRISDFGFQLLISEQTVNISTYVDGQEIPENYIKEFAFEESMNISVRVYANSEKIYLSGANITFFSANYNKHLPETSFPWYNSSITISSSYFSTGINYVYLQFQLEDYTTDTFSFQLLISEQAVEITTVINGEEIAENSIKELSFKEVINISARVFAEGEEIYLSGANITFFSDNYNKHLPETSFPWYNSSITISSSYFSSGINYIYLKFQLEDYTTSTFSFQFLIKTQTLNLTVSINSRQIPENYLLNFDFNDQFSISARSYANTEEIYLTGGVLTLIVNDYEENVTDNDDYWYNTTISCSPDFFSLGVNYLYLRFQKENYTTTIFSFQILIDQIDLQIDSIGFDDTINAFIGDTLNIQLRLLDPNTNASIESASISFTWEYGLGTFNLSSPGNYQYFLNLPENLEGNYQFNIFVIPENIVYKPAQHSFVIVINAPISEEEFPALLLWIIIGILISIVSALGILSVRSYVLLPRKRKKESELLSKTQRFKDLRNIQAIVIVHTLSGIPIYSKSYSILEKRKKELFSGFIQAITMVGEEFSEDIKAKPEEEVDSKGFGKEKIIELDFKQFQCLIADKEEVRAIFILKEKASMRLKEQISNLILALNLKLSNELEDWDGSLDKFDEMIPVILNEYFELFYKESFKLTSDINLIKLKKERSLSKMEMRVINVIQSKSQDNVNFVDLNNIIELVSEDNKDLIIEAIELLIEKKLIVSEHGK